MKRFLIKDENNNTIGIGKECGEKYSYKIKGQWVWQEISKDDFTRIYPCYKIWEGSF